MNKKALTSIIVAALVVLGVGGYLLLQNKSASKPATIARPQSAPTVAPEKSLRDLFGMGVAQQCTFTEASTSGTVYIGDSKMRGDFATTQAGKAIASHVIMSGKSMNLWMDGQKMGYMMTINPEEEKAEAQAQQNFDLDKKGSYKCTAWTVDATKFTLPTGVTFSDLSKMMAPAKTATGSGTNACSACDVLSGDEKTQCKSALKCN